MWDGLAPRPTSTIRSVSVALALMISTSTISMRTLTSTAWTTTVRPTPAIVEHVAPAKPPPPPRPREDQGMLLAGMHLEYAIFRSRFLADKMGAVDARQPDGGAFSEAVLLLGLGVTGELRLTPYFGLSPGITYLFTPRFFSVQVEVDGTVETALSFAQAINGAVRANVYLPLTRAIDLMIVVGPSIVHGRFRGRGETAIGVEGRAGFQFHADGFPNSRLVGVLRYAPIDFGEGVELDLSGAGLVAEVVFGLTDVEAQSN